MNEIRARLGWSPARLLAVAAAAALLVVALWSPVGAHDGTTTHLWNTHIAPMSEAGTINNAGNPVHWTKLKGVPAGFADGVDQNRPVVGLGLRYGDFGILTIDPDETQRRVDATCPNGQAIRSVGSSGSVTCSTGPQVLSATVADTGIICNGFCNEVQVALPAGRWYVTAKITVNQPDDSEPHLQVACRLNVGSVTDESVVALLDVSSPTFNGAVTVPTQVVATLASGVTAALACRDFDTGDSHGANASIIAIRVSG